MAGAAAALAIAGAGVSLPGDAWAAFNVKTFECTNTLGTVDVDVTGLGNTNICIDGKAAFNLFCACVNNSGTCTSDPKKQNEPLSTETGVSVEPKNGRVNKLVSVPISRPGDSDCTPEPNCASQSTKLIAWDTSPPTGSPPTFTLCTTTAPAGQSCTCAGQTPLDTITCGPTSDIPFPGKNNNCKNKLP